MPRSREILFVRRHRVVRSIAQMIVITARAAMDRETEQPAD
ncbi:hypothetical protein [Halovenus salina]|nr:hypothetical protein [Halovenus salina]